MNGTPTSTRLTRGLSADEAVELRAALVARSARLADLAPTAAPERIRASKRTIDDLIRALDDIRLEVHR